MSTNWWNGLKEVERNVLSAWMVPAMHSAKTLAFSGIKFDDWGYSTHRFVNV